MWGSLEVADAAEETDEDEETAASLSATRRVRRTGGWAGSMFAEYRLKPEA
jgi:hypothetical protein